MTRVMALDLATVTGSAWDQAAAVPALEVVDFAARAGVPKHKRSVSHGKIFLAAMEWLSERIEEVRPDLIAVEEGFARGDRHVEFGLLAIAKALAAKHGIPVDADMSAQDARYIALGSRKLGKEAHAVVARMLGLPAGLDDNAVDAAVLHAAAKAKIHSAEIAALIAPAPRRRSRKSDPIAGGLRP